MKTIKTANGMKKIEDWNANLVPIQLRTILQEHRATLVDKLMNGGLGAYIDYKFATRATSQQHDQIRVALSTLRNDGIDISTYGSIFAAVEKNEFTSLDNALFYAEIDATIKATLFQPRLFPETQLFFQ